MKHRLVSRLVTSVMFLISSLLIAVTASAPVIAQAPLSGGPYTEDFNTLANAGTTGTTLPTGWAFLESSANTTYGINNGSDNTGNTYSYGTTGSTDRALGELSSNTLVSTLGVQFRNQTGSTVGQLAIQFACEQWRRGNSASTDSLSFQYSTDATALNNGTWTPLSALNCSSVVTAGSNTALDGNLSANRATLSATITGLSVANGSIFWLRWSGTNIANNDDGLAIDDFTLQMLTPTAVTMQSLNAHDTSRSSLILLAVTSLLLAGSLIIFRRRSRIS